jgi:hypothetical protein
LFDPDARLQKGSSSFGLSKSMANSSFPSHSQAKLALLQKPDIQSVSIWLLDNANDWPTASLGEAPAWIDNVDEAKPM